MTVQKAKIKCFHCNNITDGLTQYGYCSDCQAKLREIMNEQQSIIGKLEIDGATPQYISPYQYQEFGLAFVPQEDGTYKGTFYNSTEEKEALMSEQQEHKEYLSTVDPVNHPPHYIGNGKLETIDLMADWLTKEGFDGFLKGNVFKYITRYEKKNGVEDLKKARFYLDKLIERVSN